MGTDEKVLNLFADMQFTAKWIANSIHNRQQVCDFCWTIDDVLPPNVLNAINSFLDNNNKWENVDLQDSWPRRAVHWDQPDTSPYRQMHFVFQQLTPVIRGVFDEHVEFQHSNMWEDSPEYTIDPHVDNDAINYAIQIYLNDANENCGTCMYDSEQKLIHRVPYIKNTGYILKNGVNSWHGMTTKGNLRRSLYVNYR